MDLNDTSDDEDFSYYSPPPQTTTVAAESAHPGGGSEEPGEGPMEPRSDDETMAGPSAPDAGASSEAVVIKRKDLVWAKLGGFPWWPATVRLLRLGRGGAPTPRGSRSQ